MNAISPYVSSIPNVLLDILHNLYSHDTISFQDMHSYLLLVHMQLNMILIMYLLISYLLDFLYPVLS